MRLQLLSLLLIGTLGTIACKGRGEDTETPEGDTDTDTDSDTDTDTDTDTDADTDVTGFAVEGMAVNLMDGSAAAEGLCVHAADPTPAMAGGEIEVLATSTVGGSGAYSVTGIETDSAVGLLMLVADCGDEGTVMPTATGMSTDSYAGLGDGDVIADRLIYSIDAASQGAMAAGLAHAGYAGDLAVDGALVGFVFDAAGAPVDGAVVTGPSGFPTYYFTGAGFNTAGTVAAANAMFVIPAGPIYSYSCAADGYDFDSILAGSQPGFAVIVAFDAQ
jgi:hypothetical protein